MRIIKLNAIDSTNSFLKELVQNASLKNFTIVVANEQTNGRGQMGTTWFSEPGKNLLYSVFVKFDGLLVNNQVLINYVISNAIIEVLNHFGLSKLAIKWPNDILSSNKKIAGILVENVIKNDKIKSSIIGVGLNVNQANFSDELNATSILKEIHKEINIDDVLELLIKELKSSLANIDDSPNLLKNTYLKSLYKINIPSMFKTTDEKLFIGKIIGVSSIGKLQIQLDDDSIKEFGIKEIQYV